jgi:hypothetical protein
MTSWARGARGIPIPAFGSPTASHRIGDDTGSPALRKARHPLRENRETPPSLRRDAVGHANGGYPRRRRMSKVDDLTGRGVRAVISPLADRRPPKLSTAGDDAGPPALRKTPPPPLPECRTTPPRRRGAEGAVPLADERPPNRGNLTRCSGVGSYSRPTGAGIFLLPTLTTRVGADLRVVVVGSMTPIGACSPLRGGVRNGMKVR